MNDVNHIVKKSITKLSELQEELQELDSQLLVTQVSLCYLAMRFQESVAKIRSNTAIDLLLLYHCMTRLCFYW